MSDKGKKIFLAVTIIGSFLIYSIIYYARVFNDAPFKFTEFKSFVFKYGKGDSLVNTYNSLTGDYQYINDHDSLVKINLRLSRADLDSIHRKAAELGFWDFPSDETNNDTSKLKGIKPLRYYIEFNYKRKSKKVVFDVSFNGDTRLRDANVQFIKDIKGVLADAEDKQRK
jgi:hypothetical protein